MKLFPLVPCVALLLTQPAVAGRVWLQPALTQPAKVSPELSIPIGIPSGESSETLDGASPADSLLGEWWTEGKEGRVKIVKTKNNLYEVILLDGKDIAKKDEHNPDPKLRERTLRGIVLMWNLRFEDDEYVGGYCYNPTDGETYRVKMKITGPTTLRLRGYLAVPLLGKSQDWTRAH